ncbi:MAG: hypothetical protein PVF47_11635 [Anaerolineae bacterium]
MWPRRNRPGARQRAPSPTYFSVVEPGAMTFRLLVVEVSEGGATVWGWSEQPGPGRDGIEPAWLSTACDRAQRRAEEMAQDLAGRWILPDRMLVGLPSSQIVGRAWAVAQKRARPRRPVEERELEALLSRALRLAVNRLLSTAPGDGEWLLLDATPLVLTIDGRGVTDPVGFRAREMGAAVFAALAPAEMLAAWRAAAEMLEFVELTLVAEPRALAAGLNDPQAMLVDVGDATTNLIWCQTGRPGALDWLPSGSSALTRSLVRKWNLAPDRAERLKKAYCTGRLDPEAQGQVQDVILPPVQAWLAQVESALARMMADGLMSGGLVAGETLADEALPAQLYLLGGGSAVPEVGESLQALAWSEKLRFSRYPQVRLLRPTDVPGVVNRTEAGREPGDVAALALAAWAARQQAPPGRPERLLTALCAT